jgi:Periplasmic protease
MENEFDVSDWNQLMHQFYPILFQVYPGTPAAAELKRGDIIRKIGDYDSRDLRHKDATNFFQSSDTSISLGIQRYDFVA